MAEHAAPAPRSRVRVERDAHEVEFGRIVSFSDGVFAIAITLLTLTLEVPKVPSGDDPALVRALAAEIPDLLAYAISFAVVGRFWIIHHRFYASLQSFDGRLMAGNLLYLALIVLVPFASDLLGKYGDESVAPMIYATILGFAGLVNTIMIRYSLTAGHISPHARAETLAFGGRLALVTPVVFFVSIPLALLSPFAAELFWLLSLFGARWMLRASASAKGS